MILGVHLATSPFTLCIMSSGSVVYSVSYQNTHAVTENFVQEIHKACEAASCTLQDLSCIGVTTGPGSYTGIRVGVSVIKTIGQLLKIPVYGVSTLEAFLMPYQALSGLYIALMPSRTSEWVGGLFGSRDHRIHRMCPDFIWQEATMYKKLLDFREKVTVVGILPAPFLEKLKDVPHLQLVPSQVQAQAVATLAAEMLKNGEVGYWKTLKPHYSHLPSIGQKKRAL